jgi:hypothetical protein
MIAPQFFWQPMPPDVQIPLGVRDLDPTLVEESLDATRDLVGDCSSPPGVVDPHP